MKNTKTNAGSFAIAKLKAKRRGLLTIIAIAVITVTGFSFTACSKILGAAAKKAVELATGGDSKKGGGISGLADIVTSGIGPGFLTINGLPENMASVGVFKSGTDISTKSKYKAAMDSDSSGVAAGFNMNISEFNKIPLVKTDYSGGIDMFWKGTGSFPVVLVSPNNTVYYASVKFSKGSATVNFSSFKEVK
jgi:hypothetical protein